MTASSFVITITFFPDNPTWHSTATANNRIRIKDRFVRTCSTIVDTILIRTHTDAAVPATWEDFSYP
ncbi:hypothetical protein RSAG8_12738, partial [Rhizoctonia solani AG-8 WAC10335]